PNSQVSQAREGNGGLICIAYPWGVSKTVDRITVNPRDSNRTLLFTLTFKSFIDADRQFEPRDHFLQSQQYFYNNFHMVQGTNPNITNPFPSNDGYIKWPKIILHGHETIVYKFTADLPVNQDGLITPGVYCNRGELWPDGEIYYIYSKPDACTRSSS